MFDDDDDYEKKSKKIYIKQKYTSKLLSGPIIVNIYKITKKYTLKKSTLFFHQVNINITDAYLR